MKESTIFTISLVLTIIGLGFLFLYAEEVDLGKVENLDAYQPTQTVKLQGTVGQLRVSEKALFLQVAGQRTETIDVIFFPKEEVFLQEGDNVEVTGQVEEYQGKKEVIAQKVVAK